MGQISTENTPLERFLRLPEFTPALEFLGGRVIQKISPMFPHSVIQTEMVSAVNAFARPRKLGRAFAELLAVLGGSAQVPDLSYYVTGRLPKFVRGQEFPVITIPPDITVEILSPGQRIGELRSKIRFALKHGSKLGWWIDPGRERIGVIRPGQKTEVLQPGHVLSGEAVLPGFSIPVEAIFGWLEQD